MTKVNWLEIGSVKMKPKMLFVSLMVETPEDEGQSQAVVCVSTPRMYPRSGYFLVMIKNVQKM